MAKYEYTSWGGAIKRTLLTDWEQPEKVVIHTEVDLPDLEVNNRALAELQLSTDPTKLVARVPMTVYERSVLEGWDESDWKKWLNSADAKPFRVWNGRL